MKAKGFWKVLFVVISVTIFAMFTASCGGTINEDGSKTNNVVDNDHDGHDRASDCNDSDPNVWDWEQFRPDLDGDGLPEDGDTITACVGNPNTYPDDYTINDPPPWDPCPGDATNQCGNTPPSCSVTSPSANQTLVAPANLTISAMCTDSDGTVVRVETYLNGSNVHTDTASPWDYNVTGLVAGNYTVYVIGYDNDGAPGQSTTINFVVNAAAEIPPTCQISGPTNGHTYTQPANFPITANTVDQDGFVDMVEFYLNGGLLNTDSATPWSYDMTGLTAGSWNLQCRSRDNHGNWSNMSAMVTITVNSPNLPPTVTLIRPTTGQSFNTPATVTMEANPVDDVSVAKVEFYLNNQLIATRFAAPYTADATGLSAGSYAIYAKAYDNLNNSAVSTTANITVTAANQPPTGRISSPADNTTLTAPTTINVTVETQDPDTGDYVASVQLLNNGTVVATDTTAPFNFQFTGVGVSTNRYTAIITDNHGLTATTSAVTVYVQDPANLPPSGSITSPTASQHFASNSNVPVVVTAIDTDGTVTQVQIIRNGVVIATLTNGTWTYTMNNMAPGTYNLQATIRDNDNAEITTSTVTFYVDSATNVPPTGAIINPTPNQHFVANSTVQVDVTASDTAPGTVASVALYVNGVLFGTDTTSAYGFSLTNRQPGTYNLYAIVTDNEGATFQTPVVTFIVDAIVNQPYLNIYYQMNGTKSWITMHTDCYATWGAEGTSTNVASLTVNKTPSASTVTNGICRGAYDFSPVISNACGTDENWTPCQDGNHNLHSGYPEDTNNDGVMENQGVYLLRAIYSPTGNASDAREIPWTLEDNGQNGGNYVFYLTGTPPNRTPWGNITTPTNGAHYPAGSNVSITYWVGDPDGTVNQVQVLSNGSVIATLNSTPWSYTMTNLTPGTYNISGIVRDDDNATASTGVVTFYIDAATNQSPVVNVSTPTNGSHYPAPATFTVTASATDADGNVQSVTLYRDNISQGADTSAPYSWTQTNLSQGTYTYHATAVDDDGASTTSANIVVYVDAAGNVAPTVNITSPANNGTFTAPVTLTYEISASDSDGYVTSVSLICNSSNVGSDTSSPYQITRSNLAAGTYACYASATDDDGVTNNSSTVTITVNPAVSNQAPTVSITSPANNATGYTAPATITYNMTASDSDGYVTNVSLICESSNVGSDASSPYAVVRSNLAAGTYNCFAQATDDDGATSNSATVTITVAASTSNQPPTVSITSPANNATGYTAPATITYNMTASDSDGYVTNVALMCNSSNVGSDASSPYAVVRSNLAAGTYNCYATATDDDGATSNSATITITVAASTGNQPPIVYISDPANGYHFNAPATFSITAIATDPDGQIARVDFLRNSANVGNDISATYTINQSNLTAGTYTFTVVATDDDGATTTSTAITVYVDNATKAGHMTVAAQFTSSNSGIQAYGNVFEHYDSWEMLGGVTSNNTLNVQGLINFEDIINDENSALINYGETLTVNNTQTINPYYIGLLVYHLNTTVSNACGTVNYLPCANAAGVEYPNLASLPNNGMTGLSIKLQLSDDVTDIVYLKAYVISNGQGGGNILVSLDYGWTNATFTGTPINVPKNIEQDFDGDGIINPLDNCMWVAGDNISLCQGIDDNNDGFKN